jgi:hypothetical protein
MLSDLDTEMSRFIRHLIGSDKASGYITVSGTAIERWMLKAMCGYLVSGYAHPDLRNCLLPDDWLDMLFGNRDIPDGQGFYAITGSFREKPDQLGLLSIRGERAGEMLGISFFVSGYPFMLLLGPMPNWIIETLSRFIFHYRPDLINIRQNSTEREIRTGWVTGNIVEIDVTGPHPV